MLGGWTCSYTAVSSSVLYAILESFKLLFQGGEEKIKGRTLTAVFKVKFSCESLERFIENLGRKFLEKTSSLIFTDSRTKRKKSSQIFFCLIFSSLASALQSNCEFLLQGLKAFRI